MGRVPEKSCTLLNINLLYSVLTDLRLEFSQDEFDFKQFIKYVTKVLYAQFPEKNIHIMSCVGA